MKLLNAKSNANQHNHITDTKYDIVVFSHIRWDLVYHRPQHIVNRLATNKKILYVEEPIRNLENKHQIFEISNNLHVFQPCVANNSEIAEAICEILGTNKIDIGWFYSANFIDVFQDLNFGKVIYDSLEDLSLSKFGPKNFRDKEIILLNKTNFIFTTCEKSFEEKKSKFKNVFLFPNSVDFDHFNISHTGLLSPTDIKSIPRPIIGYFGTLDERIDFDLLNKTAFLLPNVSFVMIGPISNLKYNEIPKEPNIYYLGSKSYYYLPNYLQSFDVAMMPMICNDETTASPIKMLEYMVGGIPIISTPIAEISQNYSHCIRIVKTCDEFIKEIDLALNDTEKFYLVDYERILNNTSWDKTVREMENLILKSM